MRLPQGNEAIVTDEKLYGYLLNIEHPTQPGHAMLFKRLLGLTTDNAEELRAALLHAAATLPADPGQSSRFGEKFEIKFPMSGPRGTYNVLSVWLIPRGHTRPRLITAMIQ